MLHDFILMLIHCVKKLINFNHIGLFNYLLRNMVVLTVTYRTYPIWCSWIEITFMNLSIYLCTTRKKTFCCTGSTVLNTLQQHVPYLLYRLLDTANTTSTYAKYTIRERNKRILSDIINNGVIRPWGYNNCAVLSH